jgi:hypothetical protein
LERGLEGVLEEVRRVGESKRKTLLSSSGGLLLPGSSSSSSAHLAATGDAVAFAGAEEADPFDPSSSLQIVSPPQPYKPFLPSLPSLNLTSLNNILSSLSLSSLQSSFFSFYHSTLSLLRSPRSSLPQFLHSSSPSSSSASVLFQALLPDRTTPSRILALSSHTFHTLSSTLRRSAAQTQTFLVRGWGSEGRERDLVVVASLSMALGGLVVGFLDGLVLSR